MEVEMETEVYETASQLLSRNTNPINTGEIEDGATTELRIHPYMATQAQFNETYFPVHAQTKLSYGHNGDGSRWRS
jgi:hypothetical protein